MRPATDGDGRATGHSSEPVRLDAGHSIRQGQRTDPTTTGTAGMSAQRTGGTPESRSVSKISGSYCALGNAHEAARHRGAVNKQAIDVAKQNVVEWQQFVENMKNPAAQARGDIDDEFDDGLDEYARKPDEPINLNTSMCSSPARNE